LLPTVHELLEPRYPAVREAKHHAWNELNSTGEKFRPGRRREGKRRGARG
jgi:hypothetical protein